jgi:hypothetical protein
MTRIADERAILSIDPSSRGLAFVAFENGELIDWGTRGPAGDASAALAKLFARYGTDALVIEDPTARGAERRPAARALLTRLAADAEAAQIDVARVPRRSVRVAWARQGLTRKEAVASIVAERFPELGPLVPLPRKLWQSEKARLNIFDALTLLLFAFPSMTCPDVSEVREGAA